MVAYTSAFLAAANLLALAHAAPAQPVCQAVISVVTGSPIWVPRADPTTSAGWGAWPGKGSSVSSSTTTTLPKPSLPSITISTFSNGKTTWTTSSTISVSISSPIPVITSTITPTISTSDVVPTTLPVISSDEPTTTVSTPEPVTTTPAPAAPTCDTVSHNVFTAGASGSCGCEFTVNCNRHSPYNSGTSFWERTSGEIVDTLQDCLNICNDNAACTAVVWSNQDGESASDYKRCWQTSGLPQPDSDGYGQLSYKGSCSSSCSQNYSG